MTGEADAELASNSGEASLGEGTAIDAAEPPQPQPQKGWPSKRLPRDTRYFVMKSFSMRDILISLKKGIWATQSRNEAKLNSAQSVRARCCCAATGPPPPAFRAARLRPRGCSPTPNAHPDTHTLHTGLRVRHPLLLRQRVPGIPRLRKDGAPLPCRPLQHTRTRKHKRATSPVCCVRQTSRTGEAKEDDGSAALWTAVDGTQSWGGVFKVARRPARTACPLRAHCVPTACPLLPRHPRPKAHVAWRSP